MKKLELGESKTLLGVRRIKEAMASEAEKIPGYYPAVKTAWGAKLLKSCRTDQNASGKQSKR